MSELTGIVACPAGAWRAAELVGVGKAPFASFGVYFVCEDNSFPVQELGYNWPNITQVVSG